MRILQISTSIRGGAGRAALRLNEELCKGGHNSVIWSSDTKSIRPIRARTIDLKGKIYTFGQRISTRSQYEFVSAFSVSKIGIDEISNFKPDVINIHNWYNMLSSELLQEIMQKFPTILTLHDERLLTGGCHTAFECEGIWKDCSNCPANLLARNKIQLNKSNFNLAPLTQEKYGIVAPSEWLIMRSLRTHVGVHAKFNSVIPNIVPETKINSPEPRKQDRAFRIGFVASNLETKFKGLEILSQAISQIRNERKLERDISLTLIGRYKSCENVLNMFDRKTDVLLGELSTEDLNKAFQYLDLVVVPSTWENLPNVIIEAQLAGTAVLATRVGGIPEIIQHEKTGFLCEPTSHSIAKEIVSAYNFGVAKVTLEARKNARIRHNPLLVTQKYLRAYQEVSK